MGQRLFLGTRFSQMCSKQDCLPTEGRRVFSFVTFAGERVQCPWVLAAIPSKERLILSVPHKLGHPPPRQGNEGP